jgi:hypothetical protein
VVTVGAELPQSGYEAARDRSDMVETNGVLTHTLPPAERAQVSAYRPRDTRWSPERECLAVKAVSASSSARSCRPSATIDRDLTSRWSPSGSGRQSITYDLSATQEVSAVSVVWYAAKAGRTAFAIETSTDGKQFAKVDEGLLTGRGTITTLRTFVTQEARYVRVVLDAPVSVYEVGTHGKAEASQARAQ